MAEIEIASIYRMEGDGTLRAFCDIIISNTLLVKGLRIMRGSKGLFVKMPSKQGKDGKWYESIRPTSKEVRQQLNDLILQVYEE